MQKLSQPGRVAGNLGAASSAAIDVTEQTPEHLQPHLLPAVLPLPGLAQQVLASCPTQHVLSAQDQRNLLGHRCACVQDQLGSRGKLQSCDCQQDPARSCVTGLCNVGALCPPWPDDFLDRLLHAFSQLENSGLQSRS